MFQHIIKTIGVFNQKGGVGKTSVSTVIAEYLALYKSLRCLVVDTDMQCNTSDYWVGMEPAIDQTGGQLPPKHPEYDGESYLEERSTIADIFFGKGVIPYSTYLDGKTHGSGLVDVMLGHPAHLEHVNNKFDNESGKIEEKVISHLGTYLHDELVKNEYDLIIIDTGPSRSPLFRAALRAATHALIPFEPEGKSLQGIAAMLQAVASENYARGLDDTPLELIGLLPNKVRHTNLHRDALADVRQLQAGRLTPEDVYLPNSIAFPERDVKGARPHSVFHLREDHPARRQSEIVGEFVYHRVFQNQQVTRGANQMDVQTA